MSFKPSPYQQAVFDLVADPNSGSLMVDAVAGSGKTTTIVRSLDRAPRGKIIMLAFNKSIASELSTRVPKGVECRTCHSVGFGALRSYAGRKRLQVKGNKTWDILFNMKRNGDIEQKDVSMYGSFVAKLVGLAKHAGMGTDLCENTPDAWMALVEHHDVSLSSARADMGRALELCDRVLRHGNRNWSVVDFDDMLYLPILFGCTFKRYDLIFVDEAQDTNLIQAAMLECMMTTRARIVFVGDPKQAIYGFRGADAAAMSRLATDFDCQSLPLSVSYRCAKSIVREAANYCENILFFEGAEEGNVDHVQRYNADTFGHTDAIVCRNTAPLVNMAYSLIGRGIGIRFLGREIGKGLVNLINKLDGGNIDGLLMNLDAWECRETDKAKEKRQESKVQSIEDKASCLRVFIRNLPETRRTIQTLINNIEDLFAEKDGQLLTLCTIHKSKGMEWHRVFLLDRDLMPSKWATRAWMREQEDNLAYVAITRAKSHLSYIDSDSWGNEEVVEPLDGENYLATVK